MEFKTTPVDAPAELAPVSALTRGLLEDFARRYYAPLVSFFRKRTHNAPEVQDLVQQVFLRLAQYRELAHIQNPDGFIFQTAANILKDHYRQNVVRRQNADHSAVSAGAGGSDLSPERVLAGKETLAHLVNALRQLPDRTRDVFVLRCFEGLKNAEIAQLHRISVRAVEKHMVKALTHIGRAIDADVGRRA
jgi:RNA polymerase sigma-70 factor (ECF subfamily)